jgi:hypothetical protein
MQLALSRSREFLAIEDETLRLADHAANAMRQVRESGWELLGDRSQRNRSPHTPGCCPKAS